jgi:hypothetical protein
MNVNDLLTVGHLHDFRKELTEMLQEMRPALASSMDRYLDTKEIAAYTNHHENTVRSWIKLGKKDRFGNIHKLEAEEFAPNNFRVLRSTLIAYGKIKDCVPVVGETTGKNKAA